MPRWNAKETEGLRIIRQRLSEELAATPNYPEVVGDRKIIRYLRGHNYDYDKVTELMRKFLIWRKENNVDEIRNQIIYGDCDHPLKFPKGDIILSKIRQIPIAPDALDHSQCPICLEQYNFSPSEVLNLITIQDYTLFSIYCLEYRSIILEQISEERERQYLNLLTEEDRLLLDETDSPRDPYGVLAYICVIRDLGGVGWEHLGSQGLEIIKTIVGIASSNYPELMRKCYMINVPWIFNTAWYFIKGLLAERTVAKINVLGTSFLSEVEKDVPSSSIPDLVGGRYTGYGQCVSFKFDRRYFSGGITKLYEEPPLLPPPPSTTIEEEEEEEVNNHEEIEEVFNPSGASSYASTSTVSKLVPPTSSLSNASSYSITIPSSANTSSSSTVVPVKTPTAVQDSRGKTKSVITVNGRKEGEVEVKKPLVTMLESSTPPRKKKEAVDIDVISMQTYGF